MIKHYEVHVIFQDIEYQLQESVLSIKLSLKFVYSRKSRNTNI